ncbi:MAG: esterase-like activity of phytase family protein [Gammaproteobacteria bacterium]|nr:esterase-like activity of phytase family protein [Gammaproteobacteria bacterium]
MRAAQHKYEARTLLALVIAAWLGSALPSAFATDCPGVDAVPVTLNADYQNGERFQGVRLRGAVRLADRRVNDQAVQGLSGLAWSPIRQRLLALSDLGSVMELEPRFHDDMLVGARVCVAHALQDEHGRPLAGRARDAEGLSLRPRTGAADEELLVSFEQQPRVVRYALDGHWLATLPLPNPLANSARYRDPNRALEALTETRRFGVIVAPELPLARDTGTAVPLVSLGGPSFQFRTMDAQYSGVVGMETLPDDNLLVLERRYISPFRPLIIALSRVTLPERAGAPAKQTEIARFDTTAGWAMDNFESVARHHGNRYFMISDDNASALQQTLLFYFEILDEAAPASTAKPPAAPLSRHRL